MSIEKAKDLTAPASLSAEVIEEGLRLLKRATPGGWQMKNDYDDHIIIGDVDLDAEGDVTCTEILELCDVDRSHCNGELILWMYAHLPALLAAAEQVAGLRETILSAANICEHWADESRNGGWSTHQVEPNRRLAASLRKAALGAAP